MGSRSENILATVPGEASSVEVISGPRLAGPPGEGRRSHSRAADFETRPRRGRRHDRLASRRVVPAGAEVQVHPAALPLDLVDLAFAVVLASGLEREQLGV